MLTYTKAAFRAMALNAGLLGTVCAFGSEWGARWKQTATAPVTMQQRVSLQRDEEREKTAPVKRASKRQERPLTDKADAASMPLTRIKQPIVVDHPFPFTGTLLVNGERVTMASLLGKKVILDLFSSSCIVCFQAMPKLNKLYLQYKDQLNLLVIGKLDARIQGLYERMAAREEFSLPVAYDSLLFQQVDFPGFPAYVWIDEAGLVRAVTDATAVNAEQIERFLRGEPVADPVDPGRERLGVAAAASLVEGAATMDVTRPFLLYGNGGADSAYLYRSVLAPFVHGQRSLYPSSLQAFGESPLFQAMGYPLHQLFSLAYFGSTDWQPGDSMYGSVWPLPLLLSEGSGSFAGIPGGAERWSFSYSTGDGSAARLLVGRALRAQLEASFGYRGEIVTMSMPYWSLQCTPAWSTQMRPAASTADTLLGSINGVRLAGSIKGLLNYITWYAGNAQSIPYPILDETSVTERISLLFEGSMQSIESVQAALPPYGLELVKKEKLMRVLVVRKVE